MNAFPFKQIARDAARWFENGRLTAWKFEGREAGTGEPLSVLYAGAERHKNHFAQSAFGEGFVETALPEAWGWRRLSDVEADLRVVELTPDQEKRLGRPPGCRIPVWVETKVDLSGPEEALASRPAFANLRRRIRQGGYSWVPRDDEEALKTFYEEMYVPYVTRQHAGAAYVESLEEISGLYRSGELVFAVREGQPVAGELVHYGPRGPRLASLGIRTDPEIDYVKLGVTDALIFFSLLRIRQRGHENASLGYSRGFLCDGPLRYKSRLGAKLSGAHHDASGFLYLDAGRDTAATRSFLCRNPFFEAGNGGWTAVFYSNDAKPDLEALLRDRPLAGAHAIEVRTFGAADSAEFFEAGLLVRVRAAGPQNGMCAA